MNIAFVVYSHYSRDARVRRYTESLVRNGYKIDVICLSEDYKSKERNISLIKYPFGRTRLGRFWYLFEYFLFFVYSFCYLSLIYPSKQYKIIHINNMPDFLVFTTIIPKLFGAKIILDMHDPMPELYMSKYKIKNGFMIRLLKWMEDKSLKYADIVLTANEEFKKIFLSRDDIPAGKISIILNCPDEKIFRPQPLALARGKPTAYNKQHFTLLYMGTVDERFGLDIAVDAVVNLIKKIPILRFTIIPKIEKEGKYFDKLKNKIKKQNLSKFILIKSPLPLEKISEELKQTDVGIVLAKDGIFTNIIFPVKLLEFIQMSIPVIASKTMVLSKHFDNEMIYFLQHCTSKELANALYRLYENKQLRKRMARNAKKYLNKNNWRNEEKKYLHLIKNTLIY